jgi:hypothetical protein
MTTHALAALSTLETGLFRTVNAVARPSIQKGLFSPCLTPFGLIVLEHRGRSSGADYASPLLAMRAGSTTFVTTVRAERSHWLRNLEQDPHTHYWMHGRRIPCTARVQRAAGLGVAVLGVSAP